MNIVDIAGWVMVVSTIGTFCFKNVLHLRLVSSFGCVIAFTYYGLQPIVMIQALFIQVAVLFINLYHIIRMLRQSDSYKSRKWFAKKLQSNEIREVVLVDGVKLSPKPEINLTNQ